MAIFPPDGGGDGGGPFDSIGGLPFEVMAGFIAMWNAIALSIAALWKWLNQLVAILTVLFHTAAKFLLHLWQQYVKKAITWLASHVQKLRAWLKRTIAPIIARLEKIKKWYDTHILKQQLRMLQQIQMIRRFLGILRLFHVKWAAKLDGMLTDLQNRIEQDIALIRGTLNQIINTLQLAFDPTLLITRNLLGASLLSNLGAIKRIFGFGDGRILSASEQATIDHDHALYFSSTVQAHQRTLATTGPTDEDKANRQAARLALAAATNTALPV
jgi:hypothetical protein